MRPGGSTGRLALTDGAEEACCDACRRPGAAARVPRETTEAPLATEAPPAAGASLAARTGAPVTRPLPVLSGRGIDRSRDRAITVGGVALAALFLLAAIAMTALSGASGGPWLPLHLALAGGASVAISALMPFFAATLVATAPAPGPAGAASIALIAAGALLVTLGVRGGDQHLGALGGVLFLAGMGLLLALTLGLLRGSLGARRRIFTLIYGAAIGSVLAGATLSTLMLAGVPAILVAWPTLRAAHAWLNLFGFVGLVVAATLIHLFPTVVGARIEQGRRVLAGIAALTVGPPLVATGFIVGVWITVAAGALLVASGALALIAYGVDVLGRRARWTTDPSWHRFTTGSLSASIAWLAVAQLAAAAVVIGRGPGPEGWIGGAVMAPLVLGAIVQVIVGSWSHLLPAIGPGSPVRHAWQRRVLGWSALPRLVTFQLGVAALALAAIAGIQGPMETIGVVLVSAPMLVSLALFAVALIGPWHDRENGSWPVPGR